MITDSLPYTIISWLISNLTFILAMLLVVLIAACFLGRYVVFSKKMIFISLGSIVIEGILAIFVQVNYTRLLNYLTPFVEVEDGISAELITSSLTSLGVNLVAFSYAFVFYMLTYREKRFLRSLASVACLYGYYMYLQTIIIYTYAYITGGDINLFMQLNGLEEGPGQNFFIVYLGIALAITAGLILYLYLHFYRKKRFYFVRVRNRWLFIIWLLLFTTFVSIPFAFDELTDRYRALSTILGAILPILGIWLPSSLL